MVGLVGKVEGERADPHTFGKGALGIVLLEPCAGGARIAKDALEGRPVEHAAGDLDQEFVVVGAVVLGQGVCAEQVGALSPQRLEAQLAAGAGLAPMKLDDPSAVKILESQIRTEERQQREANIREAHLRVLEREKAASVKSIEKKEKVETTNPSGSLVQ